MKLIAHLLILLQVIPAYGAQSTIEWVRVEPFSEEAVRQLPLIEKQVQKNLENASSFQAKVVSKNLSLTQNEYQELNEDRIFKELTRELKRGNLREAGSKQLHDLQSKWEPMGRNGTLLQESFFVEAYSHWKKGEKTKADKLLSRALRLHPEGMGDYLGDWSETEKGDSTTLSFNLLLESKRERIKLGCEIDFSNLDNNQSLFVNGFILPFRKVYHFQMGRIYRASKGLHFESSLISCERQGKKIVSLPNTSDPQIPYQELLQHAEVVLFVREDQKSLVVDAFSAPGQLQKSFLVFDLTKPGTENTPEISEMKIQSFAKQHRLTKTEISMAPAFRPNPQPLATSFAPRETGHWYNSWIFWTITGVVAAGTATYFLTKSDPKPQVGTTVSGIKFSVE